MFPHQSQSGPLSGHDFDTRLKSYSIIIVASFYRQLAF